MKRRAQERGGGFRGGNKRGRGGGHSGRGGSFEIQRREYKARHNPMTDAEIENLKNSSELDFDNLDMCTPSESLCGITHFVTSTPPIPATYKERFCDFLVNEIDMNSNVVRLTDESIPLAEVNAAAQDHENRLRELTALVGEQIATEFVAYANEICEQKESRKNKHLQRKERQETKVLISLSL
jgi:hypothetical protein